MAKRFSDTTKWDEPWYQELTNQQKIFWYYLQEKCNHAGIWVVNWRNVRVDLALEKQDPLIFGPRLKVLNDLKWYLTGFVFEQQGCHPDKLNPASSVHNSIIQILKEEKIITNPLATLNEGLTKGYSNSNGNSNGNIQPNTSYKDSINKYSIKKVNGNKEGELTPVTEEERAHNEAVWAAENYDTDAWRATLGGEIANFLKIGFSKQKVKDMFLHRRVPEFIIDEILGKEF